jgi:hypothetical protein
MQTLTVDASTNEVAQSLYGALVGFKPEVLEKPEGGYQVVVSLRGGDAQVVGILSALQQHVTERGNGPARLELSGRSYTLHAEADGDEAPA